jgi:heat shock protein HtpX
MGSDALKNNLKTTVLLASLGGLLVVLGGVFLGQGGLVIGLIAGLGLCGASYWYSDKLALKGAKARIVTDAEAPNLHAIVRGLTERAGMPMPTVAISPADQPNAFATGRNPHHAVVCVTEGLLRTLPRDQIEGVLAHELMHVKHRDILTGSVAAAIGTAISFAANWALWSTMLGGGRRRNNQGGAMLALAAMILAPLAAGLMQMAISRSREFEADRGAAMLLGTGEPLARALENIETTAKVRPMQVQPAQANAWIHNPLTEAPKPRQGMDFAKMFSTHPATEERIRRLRAYHPVS